MHFKQEMRDSKIHKYWISVNRLCRMGDTMTDIERELPRAKRYNHSRSS